MDTLNWIRRAIEMLFRSDDVSALTIIDSFADKGHVLKREQSDVPSHELGSTAQGMLSLPVEGPLPEDRAQEAAIWEQVLNLTECFEACVGR